MQELQAGNWRLRIQPLSTREGLRVLGDLTPLVGSAIAAAQIEGRLIAAIDALLTKAVSARTVLWLVDEFSAQTEVLMTAGGAWVNLKTGDMFETVFEGDYLAVFDWLKASLDANFKRFLVEAGERAKAAFAEKQSKSPIASSGSSGGPSVQT